jgi:hypothetical protein
MAETTNIAFASKGKECGDEDPPPASAYSNVTKNFFDYAAQWINERFR